MNPKSQGGLPELTLQGSWDKEVIVHELMHGYEELSRANLQNAVSQMFRRTGRSRKRSLRELTGLNYRSDELARVGTPDFINVYMGKEYSVDAARFDWLLRVGRTAVESPYGRGRGIYATEMTPVVMQNMYMRPLELARVDPDSFDWLFNTVLR